MKKQIIKLQYHRFGEEEAKFLEVPALVQGHLSITRPLASSEEVRQSNSGWTITHAPTGLIVLSSIDTIKTARMAMADLEPDNDRWDTTRADRSLYEFTRAIAQKYNANTL